MTSVKSVGVVHVILTVQLEDIHSQNIQVHTVVLCTPILHLDLMTLLVEEKKQLTLH